VFTQVLFNIKHTAKSPSWLDFLTFSGENYLFMNIDLKNLSGISKTWKTVGIVALCAGVLAYPAFRLYKYIKQRGLKGEPVEGNENGTTKSFSPAYRGQHKPHHRKAEVSANGKLNEGLA
jgi:hypothetical protein